MPVSDQAFVTLATDDPYCQGALVLGQSLRNQRTTRKLVVLITPQVSKLLRVTLSRVFDEVVEVDLMDSADHAHLAFLKRPDLGVTLTKLHCWTLTRYSKCVFLDADTLVLSNVDELFDRSELSAAPDPGWPDCFNSGVFVFQPSLQTHGLLLEHATEHGSFDGADQGLLNSFFSSWATADICKHLPFVYNLSWSSAYTYSPAFQRFGSGAKVVHFLGPTKPWSYRYNPQTGSVLDEGSGPARQHQLTFLNLWWAIYRGSTLPLYARVRDEQGHASPGHTACPRLADVPSADAPACVQGWRVNPGPGDSGLHADSAAGSSHRRPAELPSPLTDTPPSPERRHSEDMISWPETETSAGVVHGPVSPPRPQAAGFSEARTSSVDLAISVSEISIGDKAKELSPEEERRKWEEGHIDYMGKDAFARIQEKLDRFLQ